MNIVKKQIISSGDNMREQENWIKEHINIKVARKNYIIIEFYRKVSQERDSVCLYVQHNT